MMGILFESYESRPITRRAHQIAESDDIAWLRECYWRIISDGEELIFKAHQKVQQGDYIVYLNENDIYHCPKAVFEERNIA